jgi:hypothetical protein
MDFLKRFSFQRKPKTLSELKIKIAENVSKISIETLEKVILSVNIKNAETFILF